MNPRHWFRRDRSTQPRPPSRDPGPSRAPARGDIPGLTSAMRDLSERDPGAFADYMDLSYRLVPGRDTGRRWDGGRPR